MPLLENSLAQLLPSNSRLLIAVSGGLDSMVLLRICNSLRKTKDLKLAVAHIDHGFREESNIDASFVQKAAQHLELPYYTTKLESLPKGENLERWGRQERYRFLGQLRQNIGFDWILTAHTANDRVETLLMRLLSNKEPRTIEARDIRRCVLRPMLHLYRSQIEEYADLNDVKHREDVSNSDIRFFRNRIRHELMPLMQQVTNNTGLEALAERAEALEQDLSCFDELLKPSFDKAKAEQFGTREWLTLVQSELHSMPEGLQWRYCEALFDEEFGFHLGRKHSRRIKTFLFSNAAELELPTKRILRRKCGGIVIIRPRS